MFYNAVNGHIKIGNTDMDYIAFGNGQKKSCHDSWIG